MKEIRYTHFELELAKLIISSFTNEDYSEIKFIGRFKALFERIKPEIEIDNVIQVALEQRGALYLFSLYSEDPFVIKIIKAVDLVAQRSIPETSAKLICYLSQLVHLRWFINEVDTFLFTRIHNVLISSYLTKRPPQQEDIQTISCLFPKQRESLGIWQKSLVGFVNALGDFKVQDATLIKEALAELGTVTLRSVLGKFSHFLQTNSS